MAMTTLIVTLQHTAKHCNTGADSSMAMTILIVIFLGLLGMAGLFGWMHARKERKRNEMVALSGFVDE